MVKLLLKPFLVLSYVRMFSSIKNSNISCVLPDNLFNEINLLNYQYKRQAAAQKKRDQSLQSKSMEFKRGLITHTVVMVN